MKNVSNDPQLKFLGVFRGEMQASIVEFGKQLWEKDSDIYIFMARKAACFFDCLRELKIAEVRGLAVSDRILDMDLSLLKGKKVTLVDDCVFSGTTLYNARDAVIKAGASECDTVALTVNKDWIRQSLLPGGEEADELNFVQPLFKQSDSQCVQQCYDIVKAISIFPRPYDVDFPHTLTSKISNNNLDSLLKCYGWQTYDLSSIYQKSQNVRAFTIIPDQHVLRGFMDAYKGLTPNVQVAKVRVYAKMLSENNWSIRLVPIIMLGAIDSRVLIGRDSVFSGKLEEKLNVLGANSASSRYRLLQFLISWALLRHFVRLVKEHYTLIVEERLRYDLSEMSFGHNFQGLSSELLKLLRSVEFPIPANEPKSSIIALFGDDIINVEEPQEIQARCLEPFIWLYKKLEIPAREMVLEKGLKACVEDESNDITRLRKGFSPRRLIDRLNSDLYDVPRYVSLFLDKVIDHGIAVPTMVNDGGILYRGLRHGEDAVFGEAEERLSMIALNAYMESRGVSNIYGLELQKFIVLFVQIALRDGALLERLNLSESVNIGCRIISIKGHLHGPVPMITTLDQSGTVGAPFVHGNDYHAEWLINYWANKNNLEVEKSGSKKFSLTDFKNSEVLIKRLKYKKDTVSIYIYNELSSDVKSIVDVWCDGKKLTDEILKSLLNGLNYMCEEKLLWNSSYFKDVKLRLVTKNSLKHYTKSEMFRVNRLLIEDAYPRVFKKSIIGTRYSIKKIPDLNIGLRKESQARKIGRCLGRLIGEKQTGDINPLNNDTDLVLLSTCSEAEHLIRALSGELSVIQDRWAQTLEIVREYAKNKEYSLASHILLSQNALFTAINSGAMKYMWFSNNKIEEIIENVSKYADYLDSTGDLKDDWLLLWPDFTSPSKTNTPLERWEAINKMGQWLITASIIIRIINYWLTLCAEQDGKEIDKKSKDVLDDCVIWCKTYKKYISKLTRSRFGEVVNQIIKSKNGMELTIVEELCRKVSEYMNNVVVHEMRLLLSDAKVLCDSYGEIGKFKPYQYAVFIDIESRDSSIDPYVRQIRMIADFIDEDMRIIDNNHNPWRTGIWLLLRGNRNDTRAVKLCDKIAKQCANLGFKYKIVVVGQLAYEDCIRDMSGSIKLAEGDFYRRIADLRKRILPINYNNKIVLVNEIKKGYLSEGQKYHSLDMSIEYDYSKDIKSGGEGLPVKKFAITEVFGPSDKNQKPLDAIKKRNHHEEGSAKENIIINIKQGDHMNKQFNQYGENDNIAGDKVMGDKNVTKINNQKDLVQAAKDIKELLNQITINNPDDSARVLSAKAIDKMTESNELKKRIFKGLKAGSVAALEKAVDHPVAKFFIEGIKEGFIN